MAAANSGGDPLDKGRPTAENTATKQVHANGDTSPRHPSGDALTAVRGSLVVVVETPGGKYRRRCFLSLSSAQAAVERAQAKGYAATVVLARLEPVEGWSA